MSKRRDKELFSQRDLAQFGVTARPRMPISPNTRLELQAQDPRSSEQKEQAIKQEEMASTLTMFTSEEVAPSQEFTRRREVIQKATESCNQLLVMLEMLKKANGNITHFVPALIQQASIVEETLRQLSTSAPPAPEVAHQYRLGPHSSYTIVAVNGISVIYPL